MLNKIKYTINGIVFSVIYVIKRMILSTFEMKAKKTTIMYNCFDVAKKIIEFAKEEEMTISPMKLLKLTYISQGYYLGFNGKPLFGNQIQAWKYGPVIPDLYHIIKRGNNEVVKLYSENEINKDDSKFLKAIWDAYKKFNGLELSSKTHQDGSPWHQIYSGHHYQVIQNDVIMNYYKKLIHERKSR